jgi:hypothetical protein
VPCRAVPCRAVPCRAVCADDYEARAPHGPFGGSARAFRHFECLAPPLTSAPPSDVLFFCTKCQNVRDTRTRARIGAGGAAWVCVRGRVCAR